VLKSQAYHLLNVEDQLHLLPIAYDMNLQDILDPIHALFSWTFDLLAATNDIGNNVLIIVITTLMIYWIVQLIKFNKDEVINR
jgi:hypothetical protein